MVLVRDPRFLQQTESSATRPPSPRADVPPSRRSAGARLIPCLASEFATALCHPSIPVASPRRFLLGTFSTTYHLSPLRSHWKAPLDFSHGLVHR